MFSEDLREETRFRPPPTILEHGVVGSVTVVIHGLDEPLGVLGAYTGSRRAFSEDDANFLQTVANVLATAIERTEAEDKLQGVREAERDRMARDLHDEALQDLAHAMAEAQLAQANLRQEPREDPTLSERLVRLSSALKRVEQRVRGTVSSTDRSGRRVDSSFA